MTEKKDFNIEVSSERIRNTGDIQRQDSGIQLAAQEDPLQSSTVLFPKNLDVNFSENDKNTEMGHQTPSKLNTCTSFPTNFRTLCTEWLIMPKLIYFMLNMAIYSTHTFTAMYFYRQWGLQIYQFGAVTSLAAVQFIGALFWGHVADRTGKHKTILICSIIVYSLLFALLNLKVFTRPDQIMARIVHTSVLYGVAHFFVANFFPLIDAQVFAMLSENPNFSKEIFGRQRLWGTLGHGLTTLLTAWLIQKFGFIGMFVSMGVTNGLLLLSVVIGIPSNIKIDKKAAQHHHHQQSKDGEEKDKNQDKAHAETASSFQRSRHPAIRLLMNGHFLFLLFVVLLAGYVRSVMSYFLGFYMQIEMDQTPVMIAFTYLFRMGSEVAIFFFNKPLLRYFGVYWLLIIAQIAGILRVLGYGYLPPKGNWFYLSFAIELLKGTSTACLVSAGVRLSNDIAPPGCGNTAQAYFSGIYSGLSAALGGALGGLIIYLLPGHSVAGMFRVTFFISFCALIIQILKYSLIDRVILVPKHWRRDVVTS